MTTSTSSTSFRWQLTWLLALAAAVLVAFFAVRWTAEHRVRQEANAVAVSHANLLASTIRGLPRFMDSGWMSWNASYDLRRFSTVGGVFRFQLFDTDGRLILKSADLNNKSIDWTWVNLRDHYAAHRERVTNPSVFAGKAVITLREGGPGTRWPDYYSDALIPFPIDANSNGVIRVFVDQTERHRAITQDYLRLAMVGALLLIVLMALGITQWRVRQREQGSVEEKIRYLARYDALTGALNRASFNSMADEAVAHFALTGETFAVHFLDLDGFKLINDTQGHAGGDQVLKQVSERLRAVMSPTDHLARIGGDEFAVLQTQMAPGTPVKKMADQIVNEMRQPFDIDGESIQCGASMGVAIYHVGVPSAQQLVKRADLALYAAKSTGGNGYRLYSEELQEQIQVRERFIADLAKAVENERFKLAYQPLFDGAGKHVTGYEALLRWDHPTRGPISPGEFVPIAEEAGLIGALGSWVLRQACSDASNWPNHITVAVNLSVVQFQSGDLVREVSDRLAEFSLDPSRLELEITESLLMTSTERVTGTLHGLKALGVGISMDDFGTGYSSLAYLWRFPFDKLKIDRAFTMNIEDDPKVDLIVSSIVSLAHSMNIRVNAEGVETEAQRDALRDHGCDELQGFLLGRPKPLDELNHYPYEAPADTLKPVETAH